MFFLLLHHNNHHRAIFSLITLAYLANVNSANRLFSNFLTEDNELIFVEPQQPTKKTGNNTNSKSPFVKNEKTTLNHSLSTKSKFIVQIIYASKEIGDGNIGKQNDHKEKLV